MSGYVWRDPSRYRPPASEKEMPPGPPEGACVFCGQAGVPLKRDARARDPVCADDEACAARGWRGTGGG